MSAILESTADGYRLAGTLDFDAVAALYGRTDELLARSPARLELDGVEAASGAAVALLLEWRREAHRRGVELTLGTPPEALLRLARPAGVAHLLEPGPELSARAVDPV